MILICEYVEKPVCVISGGLTQILESLLCVQNHTMSILFNNQLLICGHNNGCWLYILLLEKLMSSQQPGSLDHPWPSFFFLRENANGVGEGQRKERESLKQALCPAQETEAGLNLNTLRLWPTLKSRMGH